MKKQTLLFLAILLNLRAIANKDSVSKSINYRTVEIISNRLLLPFEENNRDIQIIDRKTIESLPANSISEILSYCNGIDVRQRGPNGVQSDISINGGTFDQSLILINGIKMIDPQTGHHIMNLPISISSIERIEILKGATASRYGLNALVGAINIITKKDLNNNTSEIELTSGSNFLKDTSSKQLYTSYSIGVNTSFKIKNSSNLFSISKLAGNGYRYNTSFENHKIFFNTYQKLSSTTTFSILSGYINNKFGANSFYASPADKNAYEKVESFIAFAELNKVLNKLIISPKFSYRYNYDNYIFIKQKPEVYENNHYSHSYSTEINASYQFENSTFAVGIENRIDRLNSNNLGRKKRINSGLFLEYRIGLFQEKIKLTSGLYLNNNSLFGTKALPGIDIAYFINKNINIYGNWGAGQRLPTYTDLYYVGPSNIGNENLLPETSYSKEIGIKQNYKFVKSNITFFSRKINHFIDWTKQNVNDPWQASNFNSVSTYGITIDNSVVLNQQKSSWNIKQLNISYTYLNSKIISDKSSYFSRYVIENLRDQLVTRLQINLFSNSLLSITHRYQNRINYKDYQLTDMRLTYTFNNLKLNFDVLNLFNVKFEEIAAVPMPRRWFDFGVIYILK